MSNLLNYVLYLVVFIAAVLAVEGAGLLLRSVSGEERTIARRLARARRAASHTEQANPLDALIEARWPWLSSTLLRARARFTATHVVIGGFALMLLVGAALSAAGTPSLLAVVTALGVGAGLPLLVVSSLASRRQKRFLEQMPQAVDLIARSLQAGHPVATAIAVVAKQMPDPMGPEFAEVIEEMTYGLDREEALHNLLKRFPLPELRMFVASLEVTRESGGNLSEVFLKLGEAIRAKAQLRKKIEAITAEGRLTFWVVSALPGMVGGAIMLLRPTFYTDVATDPLFWPMMSAAPVFLILGATTIWRMVNFKV